MKKKFTEKQIKILDVAEELIAKKGFDGTSVRDICSKANINVAMISYYFGSKEKMMSYLYQYRVQRTKESFSEFAQTIKEGKPEMQMKEIVNYVISLLFKYSYFHGFVTQEMRSLDNVKDDLLEFYQTCVIRIEEIVKRGIVSGVFHNAPKSEDILTMIIGSALFVIRNKNFYEQYVPTNNEAQYQKESEQKLKNSILLSVFAILDYEQD
ncbi:TetR/AcrR family transcriptional regulator [Epilithonimonas hominis]|jgi:AcrR family transcriptional regulator|uniref:TetR/AcrR family transcriptional regulator n=1 Tax=Epilithonimonas hominis TaxID=420404 RepID=A0A3N0X3K0_9FLAO|nr:TetR family transcriptional regulator [Epilithonimonas hominis]ROI11948.1 TetR/AcrR family transcriptional regulator [Epilithonimonas hominis]